MNALGQDTQVTCPHLFFGGIAMYSISPLGSIWRASNPYTGQIAALKLQDVNHECPTNRYERYFYPCLQGGIGMPTLLASGVEGKFDYLVIDLLGPSLDNLYRKNGRVMDLRSTLCIAMQVVSASKLNLTRVGMHR